jgi:hypothetical protein
MRCPNCLAYVWEDGYCEWCCMLWDMEDLA